MATIDVAEAAQALDAKSLIPLDHGQLVYEPGARFVQPRTRQTGLFTHARRNK